MPSRSNYGQCDFDMISKGYQAYHWKRIEQLVSNAQLSDESMEGEASFCGSSSETLPKLERPVFQLTYVHCVYQYI